MKKSNSTLEIQRRILKMEIKEEVIDEMDEIISEKLKTIISTAVADELNSILDFPLTVKQMAALTGRKKENIYKMCQRGKIPSTKKSGQLHINLRDVSDMLLHHKEE